MSLVWVAVDCVSVRGFERCFSSFSTWAVMKFRDRNCSTLRKVHHKSESSSSQCTTPTPRVIAHAGTGAVLGFSIMTYSSLYTFCSPGKRDLLNTVITSTLVVSHFHFVKAVIHLRQCSVEVLEQLSHFNPCAF